MRRAVVFTVVPAFVYLAVTGWLLTREPTSSPAGNDDASAPQRARDKSSAPRELSRNEVAAIDSPAGLRDALARAPERGLMARHSGELRPAVRRWFRKGVPFALEMIAMLPSGRDRRHAVLWGKEWFAEDPEVVLTFARDHLHRSGIRRVYREVMKALVGEEPRRALDFIAAQGRGARKDIMIETTFSAWSQTSPEDALLAARRLPDPEDRKTAFGSIQPAADRMGSDFLTFVKSVEMTGESRREIVGYALDRIAENRGLEAIASIYAEHPDFRKYGAPAVETLVRDDLAGFAENFDDHVARGIIDPERDAGLIARRLTYFESREAARRFANSLEPSPKVSAMKVIVENLDGDIRNLGFLRNLLGDLPPGEARRRAAVPLLDSLRFDNRTEEIESIQQFLQEE